MDKKYLSEVIGDEYFDWGKQKIIIQAPTGSGKSTFIIQALLKRYQRKHWKLLILCNRRLLRKQYWYQLVQQFDAYSDLRQVVEIKTYQELAASMMHGIKLENGVEGYAGICQMCIRDMCNGLLFAGKLAVGMVMRSVSVMADAFNNLSDAASSVIGFVGVKMAGKPADREHPFGHGRIEYIAALVVAFLVIQVGLTFFKSSLDKIRHPEDLSFDLVSMLILTASVAVKLWLGRFNKALGKRINSSAVAYTHLSRNSGQRW